MYPYDLNILVSIDLYFSIRKKFLFRYWVCQMMIIFLRVLPFNSPTLGLSGYLLKT